ncbi:MAG: PD-(D/E)XK nuclease domain-containing protein, partial [Sulfurovum sp.]
SLIDLLEEAKLDDLETALQSLFASIAYNNFTNNYIENYEGFYASVIYGYFAGSGFDKIIAEDATSIGRIDLSVFIDDKVFIFEFKVNQTGALAQIKSRNYHLKYKSDYNEIYIVGVEFDSKSRNVVGYKWERI